MSDEPQRPDRPSDAVIQWLDERGYSFAPADVLRELNDAPAEVLAFARAHVAWSDEHAAWRARQRIDIDPLRGRWRMLGGEWMDGARIYMRGEWFSATLDDVRYTCSPLQAAQHMAATADDGEFRAWAAKFYELHAMHERAAGMFAKHCADSMGPPR